LRDHEVQRLALAVISEENDFNAAVADAIGSGFKPEISDRDGEVNAVAGDRPF
jgi:hypothetical protein